MLRVSDEEGLAKGESAIPNLLGRAPIAWIVATPNALGVTPKP